VVIIAEKAFDFDNSHDVHNEEFVYLYSYCMLLCYDVVWTGR
jgi:hypothetical protein